MIKFVRVDPNYVSALSKVDARVQSNAVELGKQTKPYLGVLFTLKNPAIEYFVPLSSPKKKHITMANGSDFHKVIDKDGRLRAVLNFNNMIPTASSLYTNVEISADVNKYVLQPEYVFCRDNEELLKKKAKKLYSRFMKGSLTNAEKARTCDFTLLEKTMQNYVSNSDKQVNTNTQSAMTEIVGAKDNAALKSILKMEGQTTTLTKSASAPVAAPPATSSQKPKLTFGIGKKPGKGGGSAL